MSDTASGSPPAAPSAEETGRFGSPPEAWRAAHRATRALLRPIERFMRVETASGLLLLGVAVVALAWANSPWKESYHHLWETPITLRFGQWSFEHNLHFFINEVLMVIFFFVVGLEIRREIHDGELSDLKRAALPVAAALGGMVAPALIYVAINREHPEVLHGWGTPTATDIAFAVGVLALLGKRAPPALRVLLLALAIIDDIGAIVIIALFYSSGVTPEGLLMASAAVLWALAFQRMGLRSPWLYVPAGILMWLGLMHAGVHPTIAGVAMGMLTPVEPWLGPERFVAVAHAAADELERLCQRETEDIHDLLPPLRKLQWAEREALAPVVWLQAKLHPWVAFGIMPLFALANAGVTLEAIELAKPSEWTVLLGVALGLALGKPIGITAASWLATKLGIASLPRGIDFRGVLVVGCVGGVGFTMALFIANLGFHDPVHLGIAKLAILLGSTLAGLLGALLGRFALAKELPPEAAKTLVEAERSTEK